MKKTATQTEFAHAKKPLRVTFSAGAITADAGLPLVRQTDDRAGLTRRLAGALTDRRSGVVDHSLHDLIGCRTYAIIQGCEDCNDLSRLRADPVFKHACGRLGADRDLPCQPTLSRFENNATLEDIVAGREILLDHSSGTGAWARSRAASRSTSTAPTIRCTGSKSWLSSTATYDGCCYLLLLIFTAEGDLLWAELLPSKVDLRRLAPSACSTSSSGSGPSGPNSRRRCAPTTASPAPSSTTPARSARWPASSMPARTRFLQERNESVALMEEAERRFPQQGEPKTVSLFDKLSYQGKSWKQPRRSSPKPSALVSGPTSASWSPTPMATRRPSTTTSPGGDSRRTGSRTSSERSRATASPAIASSPTACGSCSSLSSTSSLTSCAARRRASCASRSSIPFACSCCASLPWCRRQHAASG